MKKSIICIVMLVTLALYLSGCAATGLSASSHLTDVQLGSANFQLVATNVSGEASASAILGVSYGFGMATTQMALIPLDKDRMLYKRAMENLWSNFEAAHGAAANRRLALVNLRYDSESLNTFFYTRVRTAVVADVVEFQ